MARRAVRQVSHAVMLIMMILFRLPHCVPEYAYDHKPTRYRVNGNAYRLSIWGKNHWQFHKAITFGRRLLHGKICKNLIKLIEIGWQVAPPRASNCRRFATCVLTHFFPHPALSSQLAFFVIFSHASSPDGSIDLVRWMHVYRFMASSLQNHDWEVSNPTNVNIWTQHSMGNVLATRFKMAIFAILIICISVCLLSHSLWYVTLLSLYLVYSAMSCRCKLSVPFLDHAVNQTSPTLTIRIVNCIRFIHDGLHVNIYLHLHLWTLVPSTHTEHTELVNKV